MNLEGGCSCGAIRYKLTNTPLIVHACHCRDCQRVTGSAFVINIWIEKRFVEATGATPKSITLKWRHRQGSRGVLLRQLRHLRMEPLRSRTRRRGAVRPRGDARQSRRSQARRSPVHAEQAAVGEIARRCARVRDGLQNRRRLAGCEQGAHAPQPRRASLADSRCRSVVAADRAGRAFESRRAAAAVQPRAIVRGIHPAAGVAEPGARKPILGASQVGTFGESV